MGRITAQIELVDRMTGTLNSITSALAATTTAAQNLTGSMQGLQSAMGSSGASGMEQATAETAQNVQQTAESTDRATDAQGNLNRALNEGVSSSNRLWDAVKKIGAAYLSIQGVKKVVDVSDELASTTARLDVMSQSFASAGKEAANSATLINQIYAAAQDARGSFSDMAAVVAKFGNNAGEAFGSTDEVVRFAELVQKQMTIGGASTQEAANAMLQLSQALGSGVLRGDELNSIFEQAPNLIQTIADYMGVSIGQIRELASEGQITADIVKAAMFGAADDIDQRFKKMPMTWSQVMQSISNTALMGFQPVLNKINELANNQSFQVFATNMIGGLSQVSIYLLAIMDLVAQVANAFSEHWGSIGPVLTVAAAALGTFTLGTKMQAAASTIAAAAQNAWDTALRASPIVWIVTLVVALVVAIYAIASAVARATGAASSGLGVIVGALNVVVQLFKNLGLMAANIMMGIWNVVGAVAENISAAFSNAISGVQSLFYNLLATACNVIAGIAEALNKLPFVEFDYSGIASAADEYAAKASAAANNKQEYTSISDAFNKGMSTFDTFQDGWHKEAFSSGAALGDSWAASIADKFSSDPTALADSSYKSADMADSLAQTAANTGDTAGSAASIADSVDISNENLKYLRDLAETEAINRFTTAEIQVAMTNNNNVSSSMDLDGMVETLSAGVLEAMEMAAEGVH